MSEPALDLKSAAEILYRRRIELVALLAVAVVIIALAALLVKPKFAATTTLLLVAQSPSDAGQAASIPTAVQKPLLTGDLPSLVTSSKVLGGYRSAMGVSTTDGILKGRIRAGAGADSNLLTITYTGNSADEALKSANTLGDQTTSLFKAIATQRFDSLIADYQHQLGIRADSLSGLDRQLQSLASAYPYVDTKDGDTSVYDRLVKLRSERDELSATLDADRAAATSTQKRIAQTTPLALNAVTNLDAPYRRLSDQYSRDLATLKHESADSTDAFPGLAELSSTVKAEARDVDQARTKAAGAGPATDPVYVQAEADVNKSESLALADQAKLASLDDSIGALDGQLTSGGDAPRVAQLRRRRDADEQAYATIAQRLDEAIADRAEAASTSALVTIDPAIEASRQFWTTPAYLVIGLAIFLVWAAFSIVFFIEGLDKRFRKASAIERLYGAPVIANFA